jgi:EAL and modified HD-GYP domain-containing signal transduction protein
MPIAMSSRPDTEPSDPASASAAPAEDLDGLALRFRSVPSAPPLPAPPSPLVAAEPESTKTLTTFDWLDTIVDEVIHASDRLGREPSAGSPTTADPAAPATDFASAPCAVGHAAVLGQVVLGYSPIIDRKQGVVATRLTIVPMRSDAALDAGALLEAVGEVWPAGSGSVSLNVSSANLLSDLLRARPSLNVMIEVPAFIASDPANTDALRELAARGNTLLLKGRPIRELPHAALPLFKWSIVDFGEDRRIDAAAEPPRANRTIAHVQSGVRTMAQLRLSFERGAIAVIGWPLHEPITAHFEAQPDLRVVLDMIGRIDRNEASAAVHRPLLRDPVLAYELLRHANSAAAGPLQLEMGSFQQAVAFLGHQPLRRWLAAFLERTGDQLSLRPVNFAALRRGLLMRMLAPTGSDAQTRGELFLCGVFSLLDRIFARPIGELIGTLAIPERIVQALVERRGPFLPLLELACAIESEVPHDIRAAANAAFISPTEINRALLRTLFVAADIERGRGEP